MLLNMNNLNQLLNKDMKSSIPIFKGDKKRNVSSNKEDVAKLLLKAQSKKYLALMLMFTSLS